MNILKKTISVFLMILLIAGVFTSCGSSDKKQSDKSLQIVTTVFPAVSYTHLDVYKRQVIAPSFVGIVTGKRGLREILFCKLAVVEIRVETVLDVYKRQYQIIVLSFL